MPMAEGRYHGVSHFQTGYNKFITRSLNQLLNFAISNFIHELLLKYHTSRRYFSRKNLSRFIRFLPVPHPLGCSTWPPGAALATNRAISGNISWNIQYNTIQYKTIQYNTIQGAGKLTLKNQKKIKKNLILLKNFFIFIYLFIYLLFFFQRKMYVFSLMTENLA